MDSSRQLENGTASAAKARDELVALKKDLLNAKQAAAEAVRNVTVRWYLYGLLGIGVPTAALIAIASWFSPPLPDVTTVPNAKFYIGLCFAFGGIGAIASVMARITRGAHIETNQDRGRFITVLSGAFRPIVGGMFGAMLYILILGGIVPLQSDDGIDAGLFFAGIAFLAGFSERWAQDTIVQSIPTLGRSPATTPPSDR